MNEVENIQRIFKENQYYHFLPKFRADNKWLLHISTTLQSIDLLSNLHFSNLQLWLLHFVTTSNYIKDETWSGINDRWQTGRLGGYSVKYKLWSLETKDTHTHLSLFLCCIKFPISIKALHFPCHNLFVWHLCK